MLQVLKRLRGRSANELRTRAQQAIHAYAERSGWSKQTRLPSDADFFALLDHGRFTDKVVSADSLLAHFRKRNSPRFFGDSLVRDQMCNEWRRRFGIEAETRLVEHALKITAGRFDLLGFANLSFGDPIDWQFEPLTGKKPPVLHWSRIDFLDAELVGDKKIIWELNRHQHFSILGQAYCFTKDERFAQTFVSHIESWMDQNPPKLGINWASSLEIAFRSISWLWALHFFRESRYLRPTLFLRFLKFLYLQARHLETYLSTFFSPNTHLTGEALGLFYLGSLLPEFQEASRWKETGREILLTQLAQHVRPDGVYFEQTSYYHRYTTDFYTHFLVLSLANGDVVPADVEQKLQALLDHLLHLTRPDGTTPLLGDDDGGRLMYLDGRPANDFRAALSTGAVLFQRGDYKYVAGQAAEETFYLLGTSGLAEFDRVPAHEPDRASAAFPHGGYYVMRDGWASDSNYMLLDCGPHGMNNCGHAHADALAFELATRGRTLLVDSGTYTYTGSKDLRDWFRSSPAHNALTVDGESSSVPAGPFSWSTIAQCETQAWISKERFDYFEGKHDGYQRLVPPVAHSRGVLFLKHDYWVMRERVASATRHRYDLWFHFEVGAAPRLRFADDAGASIQEMNGPAGLEIASFGQNANWRREEAWVSHCYGERVAAPAYVFSATARSGDLVTFLLPRAQAEPARSVCEIEAIGGRAFEVIGESVYDIVMIRSKDGGRVEMARLASDFEWTWARFEHEGATVPDELLLIGGQRLELEGKEVLRSGRRINYLVASRVGDQFLVETDDGVLQLSLPIHDFETAFARAASTK